MKILFSCVLVAVLSMTGCVSILPEVVLPKKGLPGDNEYSKRSNYRNIARFLPTPWGRIYTHKVEPLHSNFSETLNQRIHGDSDIKHLEYYVDIRWSSNAIGDIAKENGIETIYYADLETLSILGIWNQYTVHVYGK